MIHQMKLKNDPFERIKSGKKIIEIRLYDEKRRKIEIGDYIEFTNLESGEKIIVKVIKLHLFETFKDLFNHFDSSYFGHDNLDYNKMYEYYTKEEEKEYGVFGIEIRKENGDE